jgi:radical SAM superfamily enzyme YgiQ (UPF0313 family)
MIEAIDNLHGNGIEKDSFLENCNDLKNQYIRNRKILLIQTLQFQLKAFNREVAKNKGYYAYPPTGLQWLAKSLEGTDLEVSLLDLNYEFLNRIINDDTFNQNDWLTIVDEWLDKLDPSVVGVSCIGVATNLLDRDHPLTGVLRHVRMRNTSVVIAGGSVATDEYKACLGHGLCHFVIGNEGENKINYLLKNIYGNLSNEQPVSGIYYVNGGRIDKTNGGPDVVKLGGNIISTYDSLPIEKYNNVGSLNPFSRMAGQEKIFSGIQLNRGCRANCKFCGVPTFMGRGVRQFPVIDVLEELRYLVKVRGVRHFELLDDDFLGPSSLRSGVITVLEELKSLRKSHEITWSAGNGLIAGSVDEDLSQLINDSGCNGFRIGIESGNDKMLKRMRKPASKKSLSRFAGLMRKHCEIFIGGNFIVGLFGDETFSEMRDSFNYSCELSLDWASFSVYQFTSRATTEKEKLQSDGESATEFVPTKDFPSREMRENLRLATGLKVFDLPPEVVPSREQLKEIWFTFNLLSNYVYNKNFSSDGNPNKLTQWLRAIQATYPMNPYIPLFTGFGLVLSGQKENVQFEYKKSFDNVNRSEYWKDRFMQFHLLEPLNRCPTSINSVNDCLVVLRQQCEIQ